MPVILAKATDIFILLLGSGKEIPRELVRILEDASIVKCSSRIYNDANILKREFDQDIVIVNAIENGHVARLVDENSWSKYPRRKQLGICLLCNHYLGRCISLPISGPRSGKSVQQRPFQNGMLTTRGEMELANIAFADLEIFYHLASEVSDSNSDIFKDAAVLEMLKKVSRTQASTMPSKFVELRPGRDDRVKTSLSVQSLPKTEKVYIKSGSRSTATSDTRVIPHRFEQDQDLQIGGTTAFPFKELSVREMHTIREAWQQGIAVNTLQEKHRQNSTAGIYAIIVNSLIIKGVQLDESLRLELCKGFREKNVTQSSHFNQYFASQGLNLVEVIPGEWYLADIRKMAASSS